MRRRPWRPFAGGLGAGEPADANGALAAMKCHRRGSTRAARCSRTAAAPTGGVPGRRSDARRQSRALLRARVLRARDPVGVDAVPCAGARATGRTWSSDSTISSHSADASCGGEGGAVGHLAQRGFCSRAATAPRQPARRRRRPGGRALALDGRVLPGGRGGLIGHRPLGGMGLGIGGASSDGALSTMASDTSVAGLGYRRRRRRRDGRSSAARTGGSTPRCSSMRVRAAAGDLALRLHRRERRYAPAIVRAGAVGRGRPERSAHWEPARRAPRPPPRTGSRVGGHTPGGARALRRPPAALLHRLPGPAPSRTTP